MKYIAKPKIAKKQRLILILSVVFAVLLAVSIVLAFMLSGGEETPEKEKPEILEGEGIKYNYATAYAEVKDDNMKTISVKNKTGEYIFSRDEKGVFILYYRDKNGDIQVFYPDICAQDAGFKYSELYSVETNDSLQAITKLSYLCMSLEAPYFSERIYLSDDKVERSKELDVYGLTDDKVQKVTFSYLDENKETKYHTIEIGNPSINEAGHYYRVDGRDYIYCSSNNYFSYALGEYASFVKAILVAEGLPYDNGFAPYLTSNYYQWENERYNGAKKDDPDTVGPTVIPDPSTTDDEITAIVYADVIYPSDENDNGYASGGYSKVEMNLTDMMKDPDYAPLLNSLVGKGVGERDGVLSNDVFATVISRSLGIDFGDKKSLKYEYAITAIEAILTDAEDITEYATPVMGHEKIKVAYSCKVNGERVSAVIMHAVVDLNDPLIPDEAKEKLSLASIGSLATPITFSIDYTKDNTPAETIKVIITEITAIHDKKGNLIAKVANDSTVTFRYCFEIDGERTEPETYIADLSEESEEIKELRELFVNRVKGKNLNILVNEQIAYYEALYSFDTYAVSKIDSLVRAHLVVAFRFQNASDRDPYYGESLYENLMHGKHSLYGLNASSCENVVKALGGISTDSATNTASGLAGIETIEIGITPEVKEKYGLYAYTIYFELPRGIEVYSSEDEVADPDKIDDYFAYATLSTNLYISELNPVTNTRYVASDLYDVVTEIDGDKFVFLDYDFETFWARKNLVLMDINYIDKIEIEFNMEDVKGDYTFDLNHKTVYVNGNRLSEKKPDETGWSAYNLITTVVTYGDDCTPTLLTQYVKENGYSENVLSLTELYKYVYLDQYKGSDKYEEMLAQYNNVIYQFAKYDSLGTAYFKEAIRSLYLTSYTGVVSEEEQASAMTEDNLLMRMSFKLLTSTANASHLNYVYSFYRMDDRRVIVSIHQEDDEGNVKIQPVSDMYVSTFAFKKLVNVFVGVLNAEMIDPDVGYPDYIPPKKENN